MVSDLEKEVLVSIQSSWFDLQSPDGRRAALCHILALLGFIRYRGNTDLDDGDGEEGPSRSYEVGGNTESKMDDSDDADTGK